MSTVDRILRDLVRDEVERLVVPLASAIEQLQSQNAALSRISAAFGGTAIRRGPGRPPKLLGRSTRKAGRSSAQEGRACAVEDCRRPARSKGYCAAHYQKLRNLSRTKRLPADWKEYAAPNSVADIVLPRGRAAAKALKAAREKKG